MALEMKAHDEIQNVNHMRGSDCEHTLGLVSIYLEVHLLLDWE